MLNKKIEQRGVSVIEIIVAIGIFMMISANVTVLFLSSYGSNLRDAERLQADMYLQQTADAVRSMRDYSFDSLTNGTHGLSNAAGYWQFAGTQDTLGQYNRSVTVEDTYRDGICNMAQSGEIDISRKRLTYTISWDLEEGNTTSISAQQYLTNWANPYVCPLPDDGCVMLDFETSSAGAPLQAGEWIREQYDGVTISAINDSPSASHPDKAIIFDSNNPTHDPDLVTPGDGVNNTVNLHNLLVISEHNVDTSPADGLIDQPDDEAAGGKILFDFDEPVKIKGYTLVDFEDTGSYMRFLRKNESGNLVNVGELHAQGLGENSVEVVEVDYENISRVRLLLTDAEALDNLIYCEEDDD